MNKLLSNPFKPQYNFDKMEFYLIDEFNQKAKSMESSKDHSINTKYISGPNESLIDSNRTRDGQLASTNESMGGFKANQLSSELETMDPEMFAIIEKEKYRQWSSLELIASENCVSKSVLECLGSVLTNKYSEGYVGHRFYGGSENMDSVEQLCQQRALVAFGLSPFEWGVNVQPYSGYSANFAVFTALLHPHDRIMGLEMYSGGSISAGHYSADKAHHLLKKAVSATSLFFETLPYKVFPGSGLIDYISLQSQASLFRPSMIVAGGTSYPREYDFVKFREIADEIGSLLMMDMTQTSGLVAAGQAQSPFNYCDVVTTSTHHSLGGPRSGLIFYRRDERNFETKINAALFPGLQAGPQIHQIAALATQLKHVKSSEFRDYAVQSMKNAKALTKALLKHGYTLVTGGTDNHLVLWDLKPLNISGLEMQTVCDHCGISLSMNVVPHDTTVSHPTGVRIGTCALTARGLNENDFFEIAEFLHKAASIAIGINLQFPGGKYLDFEATVKSVDSINDEVCSLKKAVTNFITKFKMPGIDASSLRFKATAESETFHSWSVEFCKK